MFESNETIEKTFDKIYKKFIDLYYNHIKPNLNFDSGCGYERTSISTCTIEEKIALEKDFSDYNFYKAFYFNGTNFRMILIRKKEGEEDRIKYSIIRSFSVDSINKTPRPFLTLIVNKFPNLDIRDDRYRYFLFYLIKNYISFDIMVNNKYDIRENNEDLYIHDISYNAIYLRYVYLRTLFRTILSLTDSSFTFDKMSKFLVLKQNTDEYNVINSIWNIANDYVIDSEIESDSTLIKICIELNKCTKLDYIGDEAWKIIFT